MAARIVLSLMLAWLCIAPAHAGETSTAPFVVSLYGAEARVCADSAASEPDFASDECRTQSLGRVDPQGRQLWIELPLHVPEAMLSRSEPLGLFVRAKASSAIWLNGEPLGTNGLPAATKVDEIPGSMDAVFFVPPDMLRPGANRLVVRMSAMHGGMKLSYPVHQIALAPYRSASDRLLLFVPVLLTFGLFIAGVVYFGVSAWRDYDREGSAILAVASLAAALQLAAETMRDLVSYPYPFHEIRLALILSFAIALALALLAYLLLVLFPNHRRARLLAIGATSCGMAALAWWMTGFDAKTLGVFALAAVAGAIAGLIAWRMANKAGAWVAVAAVGFVAVMFYTGNRFLDLYLYLALGTLLLALFVRQAQQVASEQRERHREQARARELARTLDRIGQERQPQMLEVSQKGRTEYVSVGDIRHFAGAGDYVEAYWGEGRSGLLSDTLAALEESLPSGFIRTHRSHIVNAANVTALERDAAGTGRLVLDDSSEVPVSRRIMPEVRRSLG